MPSLQNMTCCSPGQRSPVFGGRTNLSKVEDLEPNQSIVIEVPKPIMVGGPSNMGPKRLVKVQRGNPRRNEDLHSSLGSAPELNWIPSEEEVANFTWHVMALSPPIFLVILKNCDVGSKMQREHMTDSP